MACHPRHARLRAIAEESNAATEWSGQLGRCRHAIPTSQTCSFSCSGFHSNDGLRGYHRAPGPLSAAYPTCIFVNGNAIITYCLSTFGEKEIITKTYGMDYDQVVRKLGMGPEARANKVRIIPIAWFYAK